MMIGNDNAVDDRMVLVKQYMASIICKEDR